jgi:putative ABC transport system permease protein
VNPWPMVGADLRSLRWIAWAIPLLIAIAVAIGVAVSAQERALRAASARAADDFDLMIGAPGSQTQLVLTAIYLQPEALPLLDGAILNRIAATAGVRDFAPLAFGDLIHGYPVIGTTQNFASRWGRVAPTEGRVFAAEGEALVGADVRFPLGAQLTPAHATAGRRAPAGVESAEEGRHRHEGVRYTVVGRLPRLGTAWDAAILVPIESMWEAHGLGNGHAVDSAPLGPPFDAKPVPGVPAIVVKPRSVADAYALRGQYRQGGTMALFPAEVLVALYQTLGDIRDVLVFASSLNDVLIFAVTTALLLALAGLRRQRVAVLRALGAPPSYVLLTNWIGAAAILVAGCVAGLLLAHLASAIASRIIAAHTGLHLAGAIGVGDAAHVGLLVVLASLFALVPALAVYRTPVAETLRKG